MRFVIGILVGVVLALGLLAVMGVSPNGDAVATPERSAHRAKDPLDSQDSLDHGSEARMLSREPLAAEKMERNPPAPTGPAVHAPGAPMLKDRPDLPTSGKYRLASAKRCLVDPDLNPSGLRVESVELALELEKLITEENRQLALLEQELDTLKDSLLDAKMAAGVDSPSTWSSVPREEVLIARQQLNYRQGVRSSGGALLRKGESHELVTLASDLDAARELARERVRGWIVRNGN